MSCNKAVQMSTLASWSRLMVHSANLILWRAWDEKRISAVVNIKHFFQAAYVSEWLLAWPHSLGLLSRDVFDGRLTLQEAATELWILLRSCSCSSPFRKLVPAFLKTASPSLIRLCSSAVPCCIASSSCRLDTISSALPLQMASPGGKGNEIAAIFCPSGSSIAWS